MCTINDKMMQKIKNEYSLKTCDRRQLFELYLNLVSSFEVLLLIKLYFCLWFCLFVWFWFVCFVYSLKSMFDNVFVIEIRPVFWHCIYLCCVYTGEMKTFTGPFVIFENVTS